MVEGNRGVDGTRPLPRANGEQLAQNVGRKVRLVVKVEGFSGNRVRGTAADGASVFVEVPADGGNFGSAFVEFEGEVIGNDCLREEAHTDFGDAFDFANYNELCKLSGGPAQGLFLP